MPQVVIERRGPGHAEGVFVPEQRPPFTWAAQFGRDDQGTVRIAIDVASAGAAWQTEAGAIRVAEAIRAEMLHCGLLDPPSMQEEGEITW